MRLKTQERNERLNESSEELLDLTEELKEFLLKLEFSFLKMKFLRNDIEDKTFKEAFLDLVEARISFNLHCYSATHQLIINFVNFRVHLELQCRLIHKRNKFASRTNT